MEVKVRCDVSVSSWCISATPVPMIVFEDEYAPMQWMLSQVSILPYLLFSSYYLLPAIK